MADAIRLTAQKKKRGRPRKVKVEAEPSVADEQQEQQEETPRIKPGQRLQRTPLWDRRARALEEKGTTPRDLYGTDDPFRVDCPDNVRKNVRFLWMSNIIADKRPILPGFRYDIYQPVTPEIATELGIKTDTKDKTEDGVPKVGMDAFLMWAPESIAKQQDEVLLRGANAPEEMRKKVEALDRNLKGQDTGAIGGIEFPESMYELHDAETRQRQELGTELSGG